MCFDITIITFKKVLSFKSKVYKLRKKYYIETGLVFKVKRIKTFYQKVRNNKLVLKIFQTITTIIS